MKIKSFIVASAVLAATALISQAFEPTWLPGGEEVRASVAARRGQTELSKLALSMEPGTWAELKTEQPARLWSSPRWKGGRNKGGAGGLHIAGWTDDAHWCSRTGQFFYMGFRQTRRFIAYAETTNAWRSIPLDPASDNPCFFQRFGHIYSNNGFDHERSRFYHRYGSVTIGSRQATDELKEGTKLEGGISYFDVLTETWTKLPPGPSGMTISYFNAMDGLVHLGNEMRFFSEQRQVWEPLGKSPVSGYHSLFRHNPYRKEVLMAGGNHNPRVVARLKKDGTVERLRDAPSTLSIGSDRFMVDPQTGRYLIWAGSRGKPKNLYEFDSDKNEYRLIESARAGYPFRRFAMPVMAFIPEYGVIMWAERQVFLYKHDPNGDYPVVEQEPEGEE